MKYQLTLLRIIFWMLIVFQTIQTIYLPLVHMLNDSAWYYMTVHFFETGSYIHENSYPSFDTPSLYYPSLGYSALLYIAEKISQYTSLDWAIQIKWFQFLLYIISVLLVKNIVQLITKRNKPAFVAGILFLSFYPFFQYTSAVMSETYAVFLIIAFIWLFVKNQQRQNLRLTIVMFTLGGYIILVKPVFLAVTFMTAVFYIINIIRSKNRIMLIFILLVFIFPSIQIMINGRCYNNPVIQTGTGLHLWNRVIYKDKLVPYSSQSYLQLKDIYLKHNKDVNLGYWWNISNDLSCFGYKEMEIDKICKDVSVDGIKEFPMTFTLLSFNHFYCSFCMNSENMIYFNDIGEYYKSIDSFSKERHHKPLTDKLMEQTCYMDIPGINSILRVNSFITEQFYDISFLYHNAIIFILYCIAGMFYIYKLIRNKFRKYQSEFLLWFTAFSIIFCSNIVEYVQARQMLPSVVFVLMILIIGFYDMIFEIKKSFKKGSNHT